MNVGGLTGPPPDVLVALCVTCREPTSAPVPVRWVQSTSGPGATLYACPAHAPGLTPGPTPGELDRPV
ncbi:hypothetical protein QNO07_02215 [Streptomyces sp. 549]|uniref:hypothetical protein n=1 Tax=Streptomyces sp. 549 TaxID=3049076 RepID=UPI0024C3D7EB|nr:hypothetical protein [Streptomyces sp. 549]MDK1472251.1 hypothetical protein [Streptomyces sp. 549]